MELFLDRVIGLNMSDSRCNIRLLDSAVGNNGNTM